MPRLAVNGKLHRQVALLAHTNQCDLTADTSCQSSHDPTAFVDDPGQVNVALFQFLSQDLAAIHTAGFFIVPQAKQDGTFRAKTLP